MIDKFRAWQRPSSASAQIAPLCTFLYKPTKRCLLEFVSFFRSSVEAISIYFCRVEPNVLFVFRIFEVCFSDRLIVDDKSKRMVDCFYGFQISDACKDVKPAMTAGMSTFMCKYDILR